MFQQFKKVGNSGENETVLTEYWPMPVLPADCVTEMDLVLGPTSVPSTMLRSSSSACGGDSGDEKGGKIWDIRGLVTSSHSSGSIAFKNLKTWIFGQI